MKDLKGFEELYSIDINGNIFSKRKNKYLKPKINKDGYYEVCLYKDKNIYKRVHRLVAETFIEKPTDCNIVNHIDSDKTNNNVNNLEWTTISGNTKHCFKNNSAFKQQVLNNAKKGAEKKKKRVTINGLTFNSYVEASKYFNVCTKTIYNWVNRG